MELPTIFLTPVGAAGESSALGPSAPCCHRATSRGRDRGSVRHLTLLPESAVTGRRQVVDTERRLPATNVRTRWFHEHAGQTSTT